MMPGRIGVVVAGDIHANRSLVRPFLEDDGYRVDAEVFDAAELLPAVSGAMPDAVVVSQDLLAERPHALDDVRLVAPDTKIVAIGAPPTGPNGPGLADVYLQPGVTLGALSAAIGEVVRNGGDVLAGSGEPDANGRDGGLLRFVASVGLPILLVWSLIVVAMPRGITPPAANTTDLAETVIFPPEGVDRLDEAYRWLDRLIEAIESGHPGLAAFWARELMDARQGAIDTGYIIAGLDHDITARLQLVLGGLSDGPISGLQNILGALFPDIAVTPGGGTGEILEPPGSPGGSGAGPGIVGSDDGGGGSNAGDGNGGGGGGGGGDPGDPPAPDPDDDGEDPDDDDDEGEDPDDDDAEDPDEDGDKDKKDKKDKDDKEHGNKHEDGDDHDQGGGNDKDEDEKEHGNKHEDGNDHDQGGGNDKGDGNGGGGGNGARRNKGKRHGNGR
jgi:hypothetical protein